jgi:protease I
MGMPMRTSTEKAILIFVGDDYEDLELWYPRLRLMEAGYRVVLAGEKAGHTYRGKHGYPCKSDAEIVDMRADDFDGVVLVGGWMPDKLRRDPKVLQIIRELNTAGKLIASICHGPWMAISAGICKGVKSTSTPGIKDDLTNAGAMWFDAPVVVDRHFISSRKPDDLPAFMHAALDWLGAKK